MSNVFSASASVSASGDVAPFFLVHLERLGRCTGRHPLRWLSLGVALAAAQFALTPGAWAATPSPEQLLPPDTRVMMTVRDLDQTISRLKSVEAWQFLTDPASGPFGAQLRDRYLSVFQNLEERFGVTWAELRKFDAHEVTVALLPGATPAEAGWLLLAHFDSVSGRAAPTLNLLGTSLGSRGFRSTKTKIGIADAIVYQDQARQVVHALADGWFVAGGSSRLVQQGLVSRPIDASLAGAKNYVASSKSVLCEAPGPTGVEADRPDLRLFAVPFDAVDTIRRLSRPTGAAAPQPTSLDWFGAFERQGFRAIQGLGASVWLGRGGEDLRFQLQVVAPTKRDRALELLSFFGGVAPPKASAFKADDTSATTLSWNLPSALRGFSFLFDDVYAEGENGVFNELLDSLRDDQDGPQVDLRRDFVGHLAQEVLLVQRENPKAPGKNAAQLWVLTADRDLTQVVERYYGDDPDVTRLKLAGLPAWHIVPRTGGKRRGSTSNQLSAFSAVAVSTDQVWLANDLELLREAIDSKPPNALAEQEDIDQRISTALKPPADRTFLQQFHRAEKQARYHYWFWSLTNRLNSEELPLAAPPPTAAFRDRLGPGGLTAELTDAGWLLRGVLLPRSNPKGS